MTTGPLGWSSEASAAAICIDFELGPSFVDASPGDGNFGEDYGRDDGTRPYPASSLLARVVAANGTNQGAILWGWDVLDSNGCTSDFDAMSATSVDIAYMPWAYNDATDNSIVSLDCAAAGNTCTIEQEGISGLGLVSSSPSVPALSVPVEVPSLWAAEFAERRAPFWTNATSYIRVIEAASSSVSNRAVGNQPTIDINNFGNDSKFAVAHEYAHLLATFIPDPDFEASDIDCSLGPGGVGTHSINRKEWQSCAAIEGMANWYSALTWYEVEQATTDSANYIVVTNNPPNLQAVTIGGAEICSFDAMTPLPPNGYVQDECNYGQAVESDWAGALFDFYRDESVDFVTVGKMLPESLPWSGNESEFWANFMAAAGLLLTPGELLAWSDIAADKEIDQ